MVTNMSKDLKFVLGVLMTRIRLSMVLPYFGSILKNLTIKLLFQRAHSFLILFQNL